MKRIFIVTIKSSNITTDMVTFHEKGEVLDFVSKINENGELISIVEINENGKMEKYEIVFTGRLKMMMLERPIRNDGSVGKW